MSRSTHRTFTAVLAITAIVWTGVQAIGSIPEAHASAPVAATNVLPHGGPHRSPEARAGIPRETRTAAEAAAATRAISGTVGLPPAAPTDWYTGVYVDAYDVDGYLAGEASPDPSGAYTISGLDPGMYTVRFTSDVYYDASDHEVAPNLVDETRATPVDVTAGDATGIGTTLALGTTISGDLIVNSSDYTVLNLYDVAGTIVSTKSIQASYLTSYTRNPFTISGVPAGTFLVAAAQYEWDGTSYVHQSDYYIAPDNSYSSDAKVSVTAGQPVTGLNLVVLGTRASVSGQLNTYGFAGNSGAALSDITVYEQLYGEWVKLPWYWNTNPAQANGSTTFNLPLQSATYKFGFEQPFRNPYLGNGPVTPEWWQQKSTLDSADAVTLAEWQVLSGVCGNVHPASVVFTDVPADYQFLTEINWMAAQGITTGYDAGCGAKAYHPWSNVTRDAMAAFLYRYAGSPDYTPPTTSPFIDVSTSNVFYKQIAWLAEQGITTGWTTPAGKEYRPYNPITRDAMAAFLYRFAGNPAFTPPAQSPFVDVATDNTFYREITWLASTGISTGWTTPTGKEYRPYSNITRDAMAAFLYRFHAIP